MRLLGRAEAEADAADGLQVGARSRPSRRACRAASGRGRRASSCEPNQFSSHTRSIRSSRVTTLPALRTSSASRSNSLRESCELLVRRGSRGGRRGRRGGRRCVIGSSGPSRLGGLHAAQDGAHAGDHLGAAERLDDVVVGAELEPDDAVGLGPAGGEDDDRDAAAGADRAADVAAVAVGQVEVEQDQVGLELLLQLAARGRPWRRRAARTPRARAPSRTARRSSCSSSTNRIRGRSRMRGNIEVYARAFPRFNPALAGAWRAVADGVGHEQPRTKIAAAVTVVALGLLAVAALASGGSGAQPPQSAPKSPRRRSPPSRKCAPRSSARRCTVAPTGAVRTGARTAPSPPPPPRRPRRRSSPRAAPLGAMPPATAAAGATTPRTTAPSRSSTRTRPTTTMAMAMAETMAATTTDRRRRPSPFWLVTGSLAAFFVLLAFLAVQVRAGGDPALGVPKQTAAVATAEPRRVIIHRVIVRRVIITDPAPTPAPGAAAPAPTARAPAPVVRAPAPVVRAPAPAPAPVRVAPPPSPRARRERAGVPVHGHDRAPARRAPARAAPRGHRARSRRG